ncbi:CRM-domain containing factor CFM9, mitochondrial [Macadamia integrifolia]|uniref:CRM-domain containing factor CFM9, mitochondrial n=1 Tax=Macadamia integrifolia TaxID=60698 RepID=UPI001C4FCBBB|nr:CRM-domain containing factor CFM9, mitochondrial [Macadamia integrifolia]
MTNRFFGSFRRTFLSPFLGLYSLKRHPFRSGFHEYQMIVSPAEAFIPCNPWRTSWVFRNLSHGLVNLVISQGKPKFEMHEIEPPKKEKWKTKKRLKLQRKREKRKRKAANKRDPRCLGVKGRKQKFPNAEARIKYKIEKAKIKEALLIERLKRYEVPKVQGPVVQPDNLTGEERFYMKKMAQKRSNYVPVGRRGVFGGVILNMHLHWKKHETVKVICKPCKPGQVHEYTREIARLSGGIPIQIIGDDTIIFYRGINYIQPGIMSPFDTLSKKRALEKSKYKQSLDSLRRFIAVAEKELELYYRHVALCGDPVTWCSSSTLPSPRKVSCEQGISKEIDSGSLDSTSHASTNRSEVENFVGPESSLADVDSEDEFLMGIAVDFEDSNIPSTDFDSNDEESSSAQQERERERERERELCQFSFNGWTRDSDDPDFLW